MNYRNKRLTQSADGEQCVCCGAKDGTVVWAHSNEQRHGKGIGIKAHDLFGAYLCHWCHKQYDQGNMSKEDKRKAFREWWEDSMIVALEKGVI